MRILLTGGAGFIGANLALHLREVHPAATIVCMDSLHRRGSELNLPRLLAHDIAFHRGDVRDPSGFPDGPFDSLIECSAEPSVMAGHDNRLEFVFHTNLVGAFNCLEQARRWNCGFLFLSTSRVYRLNDSSLIRGRKGIRDSAGRTTVCRGSAREAFESAWR